mmetsp:Transcript_9907/g.60434  ORF Transcript_9907/g.60434 Transcript_9907/m.60434 type:complete len:365 (-) Transcript_9907:2396-3490(-)
MCLRARLRTRTSISKHSTWAAIVAPSFDSTRTVLDDTVLPTPLVFPSVMSRPSLVPLLMEDAPDRMTIGRWRSTDSHPSAHLHVSGPSDRSKRNHVAPSPSHTTFQACISFSRFFPIATCPFAHRSCVVRQELHPQVRTNRVDVPSDAPNDTSNSTVRHDDERCACGRMRSFDAGKGRSMRDGRSESRKDGARRLGRSFVDVSERRSSTTRTDAGTSRRTRPSIGLRWKDTAAPRCGRRKGRHRGHAAPERCRSERQRRVESNAGGRRVSCIPRRNHEYPAKGGKHAQPDAHCTRGAGTIASGSRKQTDPSQGPGSGRYRARRMQDWCRIHGRGPRGLLERQTSGRETYLAAKTHIQNPGTIQH